MSILLLAAALLAAPDTAPNAAVGQDTVIVNAGGGGLRHWVPGPPDSGIVYVRDRTERWYEVTLTGPCVRDRALDTLSYTTDVVGNFDTFSRITIARYPSQVCGVTRIRTSLPPKSEPGAPH